MEKINGLVHIYCGDGKGKTTAAFGLAMRCAGYGQKVLIAQFLKGWDSGELRAAARFDEIRVLRGNASGKFSFEMDDAEQRAARRKHDAVIAQAETLVRQGGIRLLVLDEIISAWNLNLVGHEGVLRLLETRPAGVETVLTGRDPPPQLLALADYISEVRKVRHPYDTGLAARPHIEF